MALPAEQRAALAAAKLRVLARDVGAPDDAEPVPFQGGAALVSSSGSPLRAWMLVVEPVVTADPLDPETARAPRLPRGWVGGVAIWAARHGVHEVSVFADSLDADDARRLGRLSIAAAPYRVDGRRSSLVEPRPAVSPPLAPSDHLAFIGIIDAAGAEPVMEHGVLLAEVLGLEVGRVDEAEYDDGPVLLVGVGKHDRMANALMSSGGSGPLPGDESTATTDVLARVVDVVRSLRVGGASPHPANLLRRDRWLRSVVLSTPSSVGAVELEPIAGLHPPELRGAAVAAAFGQGVDGGSVVVACAISTDLDAPLDLADIGDLVLGSDGGRRVLVLPEGEDSSLVRRVASSLRVPMEIATVPPPWAG